MPLPLYLLAMAVFSMGTSEFMLAGLPPDITAHLGVTVGTAGTLTSPFAAGMVVGAPLMAALARTWPRRPSLLGFVLAFVAAHVVGALTTSFPVLFATRVVAAVANAGFLAVALSAAAALVPSTHKNVRWPYCSPARRWPRSSASPAGSVLGTLLGWRATFWAVAVLCLPAAFGILKGVPAGRLHGGAADGPGLRAEFAQLRLERSVPVPRHVDVDLTDLGPQPLRGGAIAGVRRPTAGWIALLVTQMLTHLRLEGTLEHEFQ
jgi:MFS transporter, DHA1 family, chloramphenicol resistance protein